MEPNASNGDKNGRNAGFLKVNLSAVSFCESSQNTSDYSSSFASQAYGRVHGAGKNGFGGPERSVLCNSSSCYVVFSIKLCTKDSKSSSYWNLCSEVITRPLFVKYKHNSRGFFSFLINHAELLPFRNLGNLNNSQFNPGSDSHFDGVLRSNRFLLSFGISIVKRSNLLYVGYGNKYLSAADLFGKRLSLDISEDRNETSLKLEKGLLFFDVYVKGGHLVPGTRKIRRIYSIRHSADNSEENSDRVLERKDSTVEKFLRNTKLVDKLTLDDYTSSSSVVESVSEPRVDKSKPVKRTKKTRPPPKLGRDGVLSYEPDNHPDRLSSLPPQDDDLSEPSLDQDGGETLDESGDELPEAVDGSPQHDKFIAGFKVTYMQDLLEVLESWSSKKYRNLSQSRCDFLDELNIDMHKLLEHERGGASLKFGERQSESNSLNLRAVLKFSRIGEDNVADKSLDSVINGLLVFLNRVFAMKGSQGFYELVWVKTKSAGCLESVIKIPIASCGDRTAELFEYLANIGIDSVLGLAFLVTLEVDLPIIETALCILEDRLRGGSDLEVTVELTEVLFGLEFLNFHPFSTEVVAVNSVQDNPPLSLGSKVSGYQQLVQPSKQVGALLVSITNSSRSSSLFSFFDFGFWDSGGDSKWTNMMKSEVGAVKKDLSIQNDFVKFIWPSYSNRFD